MEKLPDDLNEFGKENFEMIRNLFQRATSAKTANVCQKQDAMKNGRTKILNDDDLLNLKIDLNQVTDVNDFLKRM